MSKTYKRVIIDMPVSLHRKIKAKAKNLNIPMYALVEISLADYIKKEVKEKKDNG